MIYLITVDKVKILDIYLFKNNIKNLLFICFLIFFEINILSYISHESNQK